MGRAARIATLGAFLLNLNGPAVAAILPVLTPALSAAPAVSIAPPPISRRVSAPASPRRPANRRQQGAARAAEGPWARSAAWAPALASAGVVLEFEARCGG